MRFLFRFPILLVLALSGCDANSAKENPDSQVDINALQAIATKACECKMLGGAIEDCDRNFKLQIKHLEQTGYGTSSFPMTGEGICFPELRDQCVATGIRLLDGKEDDLVCSEEQASEVEAAVMSEWEANGQDYTAAKQVGSRLISKMRADLQQQEPEG